MEQRTFSQEQAQAMYEAMKRLYESRDIIPIPMPGATPAGVEFLGAWYQMEATLQAIEATLQPAQASATSTPDSVRYVIEKTGGEYCIKSQDNNLYYASVYLSIESAKLALIEWYDCTPEQAQAAADSLNAEATGERGES